MTERLVMHLETPDNDWYLFGSATADEPAAVLRCNTDLYAFGWHDNQGPCVWKSQPGYSPPGDGSRLTIQQYADQGAVFDVAATADELRLKPRTISIGGIKARFTHYPEHCA